MQHSAVFGPVGRGSGRGAKRCAASGRKEVFQTQTSRTLLSGMRFFTTRGLAAMTSSVGLSA